LSHYFDHGGGSGSWNLAFLFENLLELICRHIANFDHYKSILESLRKFFTTAVTLSWVLSGKNSEVRVSLNNFLSLNDVQFSIIVEQAIKSLENLGWSQVKLIKNNPVAFADGFNETSLLEAQLTRL
jgi:hypothetical protein